MTARYHCPWVCVETTGPDPTRHRVLEIAIGHTTTSGVGFTGVSALVRLPDPETALSAVSEHVLARYEASGLWRDLGLEDAPEALSVISYADVPELIEQYVEEYHCVGPVHGFALPFHLRFLWHMWPTLEKLLHPAYCDVQTVLHEANLFGGGGMTRPDLVHRALPDLAATAQLLLDCRRKLRYGGAA